jgi:hypothetical protein
MDRDTTSLSLTPAPSVHIEEAPGSPVIEIQTRTSPQGIPLHALLAAVQKEVPTVTGIHLSGGVLRLSHTSPPSPEDRDQIARVLGDAALLNAARSASGILPDRSGMVATLKNSATPDDEWLRMFRQYAVKFLLENET